MTGNFWDRVVNRASTVGAATRRGESHMASEQDVQELEDRVEALVQTQFAGDDGRAFGRYDGDRDGKISKAELKETAQ